MTICCQVKLGEAEGSWRTLREAAGSWEELREAGGHLQAGLSLRHGLLVGSVVVDHALDVLLLGLEGLLGGLLGCLALLHLSQLVLFLQKQVLDLSGSSTRISCSADPVQDSGAWPADLPALALLWGTGLGMKGNLPVCSMGSENGMGSRLRPASLSKVGS